MRSHIGNKRLTVEAQKSLDKNTGVERVFVSKISVPDAFGGFGEVKFINEFANEIVDEQTDFIREKNEEYKK